MKKKQYLRAQFFIEPLTKKELDTMILKKQTESSLTRIVITGSLNIKKTIDLAVIIEKFMRKLEKENGSIIRPIDIKTLRNKL